MPGIAGDDGRLSSGVLAGGVGMLMMAAVKSRCSQFNFRSSVLALRLERLFEKENRENILLQKLKLTLFLVFHLKKSKIV